MHPRAADRVEPAGTMLWVGVPGVLAAGLVGVRAYRDAHRRRQLAQFAHHNRLQYDPQDRFGLPERLHGLSLMQRGHNRWGGQVMRATVPEGLLVIFEYHLEIGRGSSRRELTFSVAAIHTDADLPVVFLGPREDGWAAVWATGCSVLEGGLAILPPGHLAMAEEPHRLAETLASSLSPLPIDLTAESTTRAVAAYRQAVLGPRAAQDLADWVRQFSRALSSVRSS